MEFNRQVFKAPSIPKISKRTISSPVIRGAIRPGLKLNRSVFSFRPRTPTQEIAQKISSPIGEQQSFADQSSIANTLVETNKILVQIQKQLEQDFNYRIDKEKEEIKKIRSKREKQKYSKEEESLESVKKLGSVLAKPLSIIAKPVKNIFDKIGEFFGIILEGIIVNKAFEWILKKENQEKVKKIFTFIAENWKIFAGIIVGGIALKALYKIIRLVKAVRSVLRFLRILPKKGGAPGGGERSISRGGFFRTAEGTRRGIATERTRLLRQTYDRYDPNSRPGSGMQEIYKRTKSPVGKALQGIDVGFKKVGSNIMKSIGMGPGAKGIFKFLRPIFKRIPFIGGLIDFAVSLALGEPLGRAAAKSVGAMLGGALGSFPPLIPFGGPIWGSIAGDLIAGGVYDALTKGKTAEEGEKAEDVPKMELGGKIKGPSHAAGGVPLLAEGGEFIVRKREVPRYEPVLKDINENGGRLWQEFIDGVKRQKTINDMSFTTTSEFEDLLEKYKKIVEEDEKRLKEKQMKLNSGGGGGTPLTPPAPTLTEPDQTQTQVSPASTPQTGLATALDPSVMAESQKLLPNINPISQGILNNLFNRPSAQASETSGIVPPDTSRDVARIISRISSSGTTLPESLNPISREGKIDVVTLPSITTNDFDPSKFNLPNYTRQSQELPNIPSFDPLNQYLNISISEYSIEGIEFK